MITNHGAAKQLLLAADENGGLWIEPGVYVTKEALEKAVADFVAKEVERQISGEAVSVAPAGILSVGYELDPLVVDVQIREVSLVRVDPEKTRGT